MLRTISNICRYQFLIGGGKKIGNVIIDTGMVKKCGVNQDQW